MVPDMVLLLYPSAGSGRRSTFLRLHLISAKGDIPLQYIGILESFFCFRIAVAKYYSKTPKMLYWTTANR